MVIAKQEGARHIDKAVTMCLEYSSMNSETSLSICEGLQKACHTRGFPSRLDLRLGSALLVVAFQDGTKVLIASRLVENSGSNGPQFIHFLLLQAESRWQVQEFLPNFRIFYLVETDIDCISINGCRGFVGHLSIGTSAFEDFLAVGVGLPVPLPLF